MQKKKTSPVKNAQVTPILQLSEPPEIPAMFNSNRTMSLKVSFQIAINEQVNFCRIKPDKKLRSSLKAGTLSIWTSLVYQIQFAHSKLKRRTCRILPGGLTAKQK